MFIQKLCLMAGYQVGGEVCAGVISPILLPPLDVRQVRGFPIPLSSMRFLQKGFYARRGATIPILQEPEITQKYTHRGPRIGFSCDGIVSHHHFRHAFSTLGSLKTNAVPMVLSIIGLCSDLSLNAKPAILNLKQPFPGI